MKKYLILIFAILSAIACHDSQYNNRLLEAASNTIDARPDSALTILRTMEYAGDMSAKQDAQWRMLTTKALIDTETKPTNDSIISPAIEYFERDGTDYDLAIAWYFYGVINQNNGDIEKAVEGYSSALRYAEKIDGDANIDALRAKLYMNLGGLYSSQKYTKQSDICYDKSSAIWADLGDEESALFTKFMKAMIKYQSSNFEESLAILDSIMEPAKRNQRPAFIFAIQMYRIILHTNLMDWPHEQILSEYNSIDSLQIQALEPSDIFGEYSSSPETMYNVLSTIVYTSTNQSGRSKYYFTKALDKFERFGLGDVDMLLIAASIHHDQGDDEQAYFHAMKYARTIDSIYTAERSLEVPWLEKRYMEEYESNLMVTQYRYKIWIVVLVCLLLVCVIFSIVMLYRNRLQRHRIKISEYIALLDSYKESHNGFSAQLSDANQREVAVKKLLEGRFAIIKDIASTYYTYGENRSLTEKMKALALSPEMLADVVAMTDIYNDRVVTLIREQFSDWTEHNYNFTALVVAGFSPQEISVMLDMTLNSVYASKSKLKRRLMDSEVIDRELFIRFFN